MHPSFIALLLAAATIASQPKTRMFTFENDAVGARPSDFEFARTGRGADGKWTVELERGSKNHVLLQSSADKTDYRFPMAVVKNESFHDVTLTVRARPLTGKIDQGFRLVWRCRDVNNYYITRCNALEDNCTIYHVINGSRRLFRTIRSKSQAMPGIPSRWKRVGITSSCGSMARRCSTRATMRFNRARSASGRRRTR
jgi:hypothetical protein